MIRLGSIWGLEYFYSVGECLADLHRYLKTLPPNSTFQMFGTSHIFGKDGEIYIFLSVHEPKGLTYWQLVRLSPTVNSVVKTWSKDTLPLSADKLERVHILDLVRDIRVEFLSEGQEIGTGTIMSVDQT